MELNSRYLFFWVVIWVLRGKLSRVLGLGFGIRVKLSG